MKADGVLNLLKFAKVKQNFPGKVNSFFPVG